MVPRRPSNIVVQLTLMVLLAAGSALRHSNRAVLLLGSRVDLLAGFEQFLSVKYLFELVTILVVTLMHFVPVELGQLFKTGLVSLSLLLE